MAADHNGLWMPLWRMMGAAAATAAAAVRDWRLETGEGRQLCSTSISQGIGQAGNPLSGTAHCGLLTPTLTPCWLHAACGMLSARLLQCRLIDSQQAKCISIKR